MKFFAWCREQRSSSRLAFTLQAMSRVINALLALWWTSALVRSMGDPLYGSFVTFQAYATLGGLGDLGMGAIIALNVGRHLGQGTSASLKDFLASGRAVFFSLALVVLLIGTALSPWLPGWLGFKAVPGSGSLPVLFTVGAVSTALLILQSYINNVNYGAGNIVWPIIPVLLLGQLAVVGHWLLARSSAALTVQYLPYVAFAGIGLVLMWWFAEKSHPELADVFPLRFKWSEWQSLAAQGFWSYLWGIGNAIYIATDRMLINAGFGPKTVTPYYFNTRLADLAIFFVITAGFVSAPKLTQWLASKAPEDRQKVLNGVERLNAVQALLGCSAAIVFLAVNNAFVAFWWGPQYRVPLHWQLAFALSLAVTAGGSSVMQLSSRCGDHGLRYSGILVGITGAINLALSFLAMKLGSIFGIAFATVIAQSFFSLIIGRFVCRFLGLEYFRWALRNWLAPVLLVLVMYAVRTTVEANAIGYAILTGVALILIFIAAWLNNINWAFVRSELAIVQGLFRPKSGT